MKKERFAVIGVVILVCCHLDSISQNLPKPRAPGRPALTSVEQLLPNARIIARRPFKWLVGAQFGLGLKRGEKMLIVGSAMDPLVVEALSLVAGEMGVSVDVVVRDMASLVRRLGREEFDYERFDPSRYMTAGGIRSRSLPEWLAPMVEDYDIVVGFTARGSRYGQIGSSRQVRATSLNWTAAQLASPAVSYPDALIEVIAGKVWRTLVGGRQFHVYDPRGTDLSFSIDSTNLKRLAETRGMATYGEKTLEKVIAHESSIQLEPNLNLRPDASGVLVSRQGGYMPETIRIYFEEGRVVRVEGGGQPGDNIRKVLEDFKDVQYPGYYPGPGVGWLEELALGVNPWVGPEGPLRRRSGMIQLAFGTDRYNLVRDLEPSLPTHHRDIDLFESVTLEVDGRKLVDRGRLTVLDDPQVRRAAKGVGDPDDLLTERWIPAFDVETGRIDYP